MFPRKGCWGGKPVPAERDYITLLCLLNRKYDRMLRYCLVPKLEQWKYLRLYMSSPFLRETVKLAHLSDFYTKVKNPWDDGSTPSGSYVATEDRPAQNAPCYVQQESLFQEIGAILRFRAVRTAFSTCQNIWRLSRRVPCLSQGALAGT